MPTRGDFTHACVCFRVGWSHIWLSTTKSWTLFFFDSLISIYCCFDLNLNPHVTLQRRTQNHLCFFKSGKNRFFLFASNLIYLFFLTACPSWIRPCPLFRYPSEHSNLCLKSFLYPLLRYSSWWWPKQRETHTHRDYGIRRCSEFFFFWCCHLRQVSLFMFSSFRLFRPLINCYGLRDLKTWTFNVFFCWLASTRVLDELLILDWDME